MAEELQGKRNDGNVSKSDVHGGHRKRILERVKTGDLCAHEYLEVLLFSALPRRNTNDLAHRLIAEFGDLRGVFQAPVEQLVRVDGIGENVACFIRTVGEIMNKFIADNTLSYPSHFSMDSFVKYMCREYGTKTCEVLDVYVLDAVGKLHGRRRSSSLREKKVEVQMRWLMEIISDYNPLGIIVVHNHPQGEATPSSADNDTTEECRSFCEKNGVILCDHFIYSPKGIYSYNLGRRITDTDLIAPTEAKND